MPNPVAHMLEKNVASLAAIINRIGAVLILLFISVIAADVCLRYLLNHPIPGTVEITEFVLPLVVFFTAAYAAVEHRHVGIDLFYEHFGARAQGIVDVFTSILSVYVMSVVTWPLFAYGIEQYASGERGDVLGLPHWPAILMSVAGCVVLVLVLIFQAIRAVCEAQKSGHACFFWTGLAGVAGLALILLPWLLDLFGVYLSNLTTGLLFVGLMLLLMFLRMPIAFCMAITGLQGLWYLKGLAPTLPLLSIGPWMAASEWNYAVIPAFILMGMFAFYSGVSKDLFDSGYKWLGHQPGGLALTTITACSGFAAICGCSTTTAATMSTIALPEMRRFNYKDSLSASTIAAGGTLGILIPPSIGFMIYGVMTEQSIGKLFMAGFIPGLLLMSLFLASVYIRCRINPNLGPCGPAFSLKQKILGLRDIWQMLLLFILVIGGLYLGVFGPNEAGAIGAIGALVIGLMLRRLSWANIKKSLLATGELTAMIFMILICVKILSYFIALTKIPFLLPNFIVSYNLSPYWVLVLILLLYLLLGCLMNIIPMMILTLPIIYPTVIQAGFDPIWFGVMMVIMMEMGQITPPVGINVFVISGCAPDIPMGRIFKGIIPFIVMQVLLLILLTVFPGIVTFLPNLIK
ncbi:MAG: TRAP transporter large permease subunit [Desulfohalobiaceae bacterium]|nr:TRAP transporter large permease subunit [Desulfohalobiaceae bacterium]